MPELEPVRPFTHVVIDRTTSDVPLSKSGFIAGAEDGFGIFERWILRLGWFTSRSRGDDVFAGDLLVFLSPSRPVDADFRASLDTYVASGGHVLVVDSPANAQSTANALLYPFGLTLEPTARTRGALALPEGWPAVTVDAACRVDGGTPLISIGGMPVAAIASHGQGTVTVLSFGSRFADRNMGATGDIVPNEQLRNVFDIEFTLLRSVLSPSP
jgi:hypothetical protein